MNVGRAGGQNWLKPAVNKNLPCGKYIDVCFSKALFKNKII